MATAHVPGKLIEAMNAKRQKAAVPAKGEMGMVMKRAKKGSKLFGSKDIKKKRKSDHDSDDLHEEKHSSKKGKKHKHSKRCKHAKKA